jgi:apolipoprotein N-acyltransferase
MNLIRKGGAISVTTLLYPILLIMTPMFISFFIFFSYQEKGDQVNVCVVQPNFEPHYEKFSIPQRDQTQVFIYLDQNNATDTTDYIVFPETSFGLIDLDNFDRDRTINTLYNTLDSFPKANLITGLASYRLYKEKEEGIDNLRELSKSRGYMQVQNSAVELKTRGEEYGIHVKGKLVPGAEIFPYSKLLFFLEPIIKKAGGSIAGHARSKDPTVLTQGKASVAPAICYESIYGYWMRKFALNGAEVIFVVTNDGWWDNTPGHRQHLAYSILRAIELRRSIARSANTGVSCTIDQHGRVFHTTPYGTRDAFNATMQANDELTFYAKHGDILGRISWLLSLVFFAFILRKAVADKRA